ncbi:MAG: acyl-CoA dehydrogenase family protein [Deltaproteobacteria bacterium]|nr:acyl-CoA dehydrogenase family protein [Deltaproteobacteria bacterium]
MERKLFDEDHEIFRRTFRTWIDAEVLPYREKWEEEHITPREVWRSAGEQGFLCCWLGEEHGGPGGDFLHSTIVNEELSRARASGLAFGLHSDIVVPYLHSFGSEEQKRRWLPPCARGEKITAIAMTEPHAGSDLAAIRTTAIRDGDHYVVNGQKTFISNGHLCDLVVVAVKTDPKADPPHSGVSLLVVEGGTPGFTKGKLLKKMGMQAQDTAELAFEDCRVPVHNLLGQEGSGFYYLMQKLQQERLLVAIGCQAGAEEALRVTLDYCKERKAFGRPIGAFQNTQFKLVEMATEIEIGRHFLDRLIADHVAGKDVLKETCMAKWWQSEMLKRVTDQCLQFFGGYGYMTEYEICKAYLDARVQSIFAGTNEIMKVIVAKQMGF